ncbi:MAG: PIN domain-containing protein, partial [Actinobacteria bacterium]|nr:PIN domain-containing protein [Actinomycetota bacterium]
MPPRSKICIIDTNALLNDPDVINSFSGAEVVIPAAVLKELDDLKRRRTDARVRYYGRKATRMLFEASRNGRLIDGVRLTNGALLRVDATDTFESLPSDLDPTRTDDLILALAYTYEKQPGVHSTVVTNDLNMLLRAEALGLDAYRFEGKLDAMKRRRRGFEEWLMDEWLIVVLCLIIAALAASTIFLYTAKPAPGLSAEIPGLDAATLRDLGVSSQVLERHYRDRLQQNPDDVDALPNAG